jgi:hypothetical protein
VALNSTRNADLLSRVTRAVGQLAATLIASS